MSALPELTTWTAMAGRVQRWHTWATIAKQSVGEHCWRVATIYCQVFGIPRGAVLYVILHHDSGELTSGDVPFGSKRLPGVREAVNVAEREGYRRQGLVLPPLEPEESVRLKLCDLLEMMEFSTIEVLMGNRFCEGPLRSCARAIAALLESHPAEASAVNRFIDETITQRLGGVIISEEREP